MGRPILDSQMPGRDTHVARYRYAGADSIYGHSRGGTAGLPQVLNRPERQDFTQRTNYNPRANDTLIQKERDYLYRRPTYFPPGDGGGNHSWTNDGPAKDLPTFRFNRNYRPIVGGGHRDMWGWHTNIPTNQSRNALEGKPRMRPGKQNNLTVQRYRGQSYSQTTQVIS